MVVDVSAKISQLNEITPQTQYVDVYDDGKCEWSPRFEQSETHCSVDVTWFPFDTQRCDLVFESRIFFGDELNISLDDAGDILFKYKPTDQWDLACA